MEKKHSFSFENLPGEIEETFFTFMIAVTLIAPILFALVK